MRIQLERLMQVRNNVLIFFVCLFALCKISLVKIYAEEIMLSSNENSSAKVSNKDTYNEPKVDALGAVLMDYKTGRVLWEKNSNQSMANASTTKIMTAVYTLENANPEDIVTVSSRAASSPEVKMYLKKGEKIKLRYLMYALMLQSSNDAAVAIAEHVSGSVENFCKSITEYAKELGAVNTVFVTPNGLDAGDHHSTAFDMAVITRHALSNPEFVKLINLTEATVESDRTTYHIANRNRLLNEYDGANGVKTGFTGKAGHCFVGAAKRGDMQLISVVLGSGWGNKGKQQKWTDTKRLLNYGFSAFKYTDLIAAGDMVKHIETSRSKVDKIGLYYKEGLTLPLTEAEVSSFRIELETPESIMAPVEKGEKIGIANVYIGGKIYKEIDLCADTSATRHDLKTSFEKVLDAWIKMGTKSEVKVILPEF